MSLPEECFFAVRDCDRAVRRSLRHHRLRHRSAHHSRGAAVVQYEGDDGNRTDQLIRKINAPEDISLIILSNGVDAAPADVSIEWPLDTSAPFSGPLIIAGILSMLLGLAAFLWALVHARQRRGPRRKQPRLP